MHFLLLGATGRTGHFVLTQALANGHTTTALIRNPSTFPTPSKDINIVQGSPTSTADLSKAFSSSTTPIDAVLITLAVARKTDSPFSALASPPFLIRDTLRALLPQMRAHGVKKLIVQSAFGAGESWTNLAWPLKLVFRYTNMSYVVDDHSAVEGELRENGEGIEWTLVKPVMLKDGGKEPVRELGELGQGAKMLDKVSRESVAGVLVKAAEGDDGDKKIRVIAN